MVLAPALSLALAAISPGLTDEEVVERAGAAFAGAVELRGTPEKSRPRFREAALLYAELHERGIRNADLSRNEGNAWLMAGELPRAILAYRRGLRLAPSDRRLRVALDFAREQVNYPSEGNFGRPPIDNRPPWLPRVGLSDWSFALLLIGYALSWGLLTRWVMTRRERLLFLALAGFVAITLIAGLLSLGTLYEERQHGYPLVVIAKNDVVLRGGNGVAYPDRYKIPLNRGVEARLLFRRGDWLQVELSGGEVGWVPATVVLVDQ